MYYVAYAVSSVVILIPRSMLTLMLPYLSGLNDGRKRASWRAIKIVLAVATPLAAVLCVYPKLILSLLGVGFQKASLQLVLLSASTPFIALFTGVWSLAYAYGMYTRVLILSLAQTVPRVILYFALASIMGGVGVALGFFVGSVIGVMASTIIAKRIGLKLNVKDTMILVGIPTFIALTSWFIHLSWKAGIPLILFASILSYTRLKVISKEDLIEIAHAFLPKEAVDALSTKLVFILRILYGE